MARPHPSDAPPRRCRPIGAARLAAVALLAVGVLASCGQGGPSSTSIGATTTTTTPTTPSCRGTGSTATKDVPYKTASGVDPKLLSLDHYRPILPASCGPAPTEGLPRAVCP